MSQNDDSKGPDCGSRVQVTLLVYRTGMNAEYEYMLADCIRNNYWEYVPYVPFGPAKPRNVVTSYPDMNKHSQTIPSLTLMKLPRRSCCARRCALLKSIVTAKVVSET